MVKQRKLEDLDLVTVLSFPGQLEECGDSNERSGSLAIWILLFSLQCLWQHRLTFSYGHCNASKSKWTQVLKHCTLAYMRTSKQLATFSISSRPMMQSPGLLRKFFSPSSTLYRLPLTLSYHLETKQKWSCDAFSVLHTKSILVEGPPLIARIDMRIHLATDWR